MAFKNVKYTWQVQARNVARNKLNNIRALTVIYPAIPTINSPKDEVSVNLAKPVMMWTDTLNGANVEYRINIRS